MAWQLVADLLCAALWWHPLVWWLRHRLRVASEAAADEASLLVPDGPDLLAACLVTMGRRLVRSRQLGWLSIEGPGFRSGLGRRVERLLNLRTRPWRAPGRGRLLFAKTTLPAALVIVAVCCTAWARPQATLTEEGGTTMNVLRISWRRSLAAAALALFTAGCSDAVADDPPIDGPIPAVAGDDFSDADGQLTLLAEDEERENRERGDRDREEGAARKRGERERHKAERREVERRERREIETDRARLTHQLHELEDKAQHIKHELEGLRDGQDAEARELQGALRWINERMGDIRRELGDPRRERPRGDHLELEARIAHVKVAIRHLHAAGLHDEAGRLAQQVERLIAEHRRGDGRPQRPRPPGHGERPPHPELGQRLEQHKRAIHELSTALKQLRQEMGHIREMLQELSGRQREERR